jgi:hypothetical protein
VSEASSLRNDPLNFELSISSFATYGVAARCQSECCTCCRSDGDGDGDSRDMGLLASYFLYCCLKQKRLLYTTIDEVGRMRIIVKREQEGTIGAYYE